MITHNANEDLDQEFGRESTGSKRNSLFRVENTLDAMERLDVNSRRSSGLSFDPSQPRSETSSPSISGRPGSRQSSHDMSDDDPESKNSILRRSPLMGK